MSTSEEADLAREKSEIDISFENVKDQINNVNSPNLDNNRQITANWAAFVPASPPKELKLERSKLIEATPENITQFKISSKQYERSNTSAGLQAKTNMDQLQEHK